MYSRIRSRYFCCSLIVFCFFCMCYGMLTFMKGTFVDQYKSKEVKNIDGGGAQVKEVKNSNGDGAQFKDVRHSNVDGAQFKDVRHSNGDGAQFKDVSHLDDSGAQILRWDNGKWIYLNNFCAGKHNFLRAILKSPSGNTPIFVHNLNDDAAVSKKLYDNGIWDPENVHLVYNHLVKNPNMAFIDLGAHVGTFSLMAAKLGRRVFSVDPLRENVLRFCKSIEEGNFQKQVTVFFTALSDTYSVFDFQRDFRNIGGTRLSKKLKDNQKSADLNNSNIINTVKLDDLLPLVDFKKAFIKMDVEEHELNVLLGGQKFLKTVDVPFILMEWFWHKKPTGKFGIPIIEFMTNNGYIPYSP